MSADMLSALNNMALPEYQEGVISEYIEDVDLMMRLRDRVNESKFDAGGLLTFAAETFFPIAGGIQVEGANVPASGTHQYQKMTVDTHRIENPGSVTDQVMRRLATAGKQAFADMPDRIIKNVRRGLSILTNGVLHGDGTGRLGIAVGYASGVHYTDGGGNAHTDGLCLWLGNHRAQFGWPGTQMLVPGMVIDVVEYNPGQAGHGAVKIRQGVIQFVSGMTSVSPTMGQWIAATNGPAAMGLDANYWPGGTTHAATAIASSASNPLTSVVNNGAQAYASTDVFPYIILALASNSGPACNTTGAFNGNASLSVTAPAIADLGFDVLFMSNSCFTSAGVCSLTASGGPSNDVWYQSEGLLSLIDNGATAATLATNATTQNVSWTYNGTPTTVSVTGAALTCEPIAGCWRSVFQNLTRTSYPMLCSQVLTADLWGGGIAGADQPWDLSVITYVLDQVEKYGRAGAQITAMYMTPNMCSQLALKTTLTETPFTTVGGNGLLKPGRFVNSFNYKGRKIPIFEISTLAEHTIYFADENKWTWEEHIAPHFRDYNGSSPWFEPGNRNLTYECWMETEFNIKAERCDCSVVLKDLAYN
jgi:hypothetical protein